MKKTLSIFLGIMITIFVFSVGLQTAFANTPIWYSNEIVDKQINMMLCSVPMDLASNIMPDRSLTPSKPAKKSTTNKNSFSILTTYSIRQISLINGDIDDDNFVGDEDYLAVVDAFGSIPGDANWNELADLDGDSEITSIDYNIVLNNYGISGD